MKMTRIKKSLSCILCTVLIAAIALFTTGCTDNKTTSTPNTSKSSSTATDYTVLGEGETKFALTVTDQEGSEQHFEIHTDKTTVGEALQELEFISGEDGDYGLYIKTVNGITVDYDKDGKYWAFYIDGEYAASSVDTTTITEGADYALKVE